VYKSRVQLDSGSLYSYGRAYEERSVRYNARLGAGNYSFWFRRIQERGACIYWMSASDLYQ
jgi:hypothetical protein